MTQEVRIIIKLILECDVTLSKVDVEDKVRASINLDGNLIDVITIDTIEIKEESEIYKTNNDL